MEFEQIDTYRARSKIIGGWLVETLLFADDDPQSISICFVPDPKHEWKLEEPVEDEELLTPEAQF